MADPSYSRVIMENLASINQRIEAADAYFKKFPDGLTDAKLTTPYQELRLRQDYLKKAKAFMDLLQRADTPTYIMPERCYEFYKYTVSPFMYDVKEQKDNYTESCQILLKVYPDWDNRLVFRAKNITKVLKGTDTRQLHFALKSYIELCAELFLWLRQKINPVKDPKPAD